MSKYTFVHPSKLRPVGTLPAPLPPMPQGYRFEVHFRYGGKFNPVVSPSIYTTCDYRDAFDCLEAIAEYQPNTKKRLIYVKQIGSKHVHTWYDQTFADAISMEDVDSDEYYEEKTEDEKRYVQLHQKPKGIVRAVWRGANRMSEVIHSDKDTIPF
jgi:hypothetical protein